MNGKRFPVCQQRASGRCELAADGRRSARERLARSQTGKPDTAYKSGAAVPHQLGGTTEVTLRPNVRDEAFLLYFPQILVILLRSIVCSGGFTA